MLNPATGHNSRGIVTVDTAGDIIYRAVSDLSGGEPLKGLGHEIEFYNFLRNIGIG
jgi:hypothetical protein